VHDFATVCFHLSLAVAYMLKYPGVSRIIHPQAVDRVAAVNKEARNMNKLIKILLSIAILFGTSQAFACDYPERVLIPNGNTASKEEMVEGQRGVKRYVADMEIYLECIVEEEKQARDAIPDLQPEAEQEREDMLTKKYNAAVDEMERVAAQFNAEVQAFRARDDG
jgi:hypothetical protein